MFINRNEGKVDGHTKWSYIALFYHLPNRYFMKRLHTFQKTWTVLSTSYMHGLLVHGSHYACAVGNMVQHRKLHSMKDRLGLACLLPILKGDLKNSNPHILEAVCIELTEDWHEELRSRCSLDFTKSRKSMVKGYSIRELDAIDRAFNSFSYKSDPDSFLGLHAVVNVLCKIHDSSLLEVKTLKKSGL